MTRTGRRKGSPDTREAILDAARAVFAERGFDGASIRTIAATAAVDPALVHHYFGHKEQLFLATVGAPVDPGELLPPILEGERSELGERLVRTFVSVWGDPRSGPKIIAIVRSALAHDWSARMLREFVTSQILRRVIAMADVPAAEAPIRAALVASQMIGLGLARFVLKIEPLASADIETVVATIGPNVQRYLTGPLPMAARGNAEVDVPAPATE